MKSLSHAGINPLLQNRGTKVDLSIHSQRRHLVFIAVVIPLRSIILLMINIRTKVRCLEEVISVKCSELFSLF